MNKKFLVTAVFALPIAVQAQFWTGNDLLSRMRGDTLEKTVAVAYIMGVSDASIGVNHCPPLKSTAGQMHDIVQKYIDNMPEIRTLAADVLVMNALRAVWPCQKTEKRRGAV